MAWRVLAGVAFLMMACSVPLVRGESLDKEVAKLLDLAAKPTIAGREQAKSQYDRLQKQSPGDARVGYAYALVLIKHRQYQEANTLLAALVADAPDDLAPRRALAWLNMLTKNYAAALAHLDSLSKSLAAVEGSPESDEVGAAAATFLGRMFGFLDGPALGAVAPGALDEHRQKVLASLSASRREAFDQSHRALLMQFGELDLGREQTQADVKATAEHQRDQDRERLAREQTSIGEQQSALQARSDKLRTQLAGDLAVIDKNLGPLVSQQTRLQAEANSLASSILNTDAQGLQLDQLLAQTRDRNVAAQIQNDIARLQISRGQLNAGLAVVNVRLADVNAKAGVLEVQRRSVLARQEAQMAQVEAEVIGLRKATNRARVEEKQLGKPVVSNTSRTRSQSAHVSALSTYEEFPFENEKQRLLAALSRD